ncbi:MAG: N-acetyl-gamma-glutamyl-phosphate reductase [Armatimonadaceae bacterium]
MKAAIIGVSGYGGGELARILARHPQVELVYAASGTYAGKPLAKAFPTLYGTATGELVCQQGDIHEAAAAAEVVFLAQESGAAMESVPVLLEAGKKVVDLSADFRLRDADVYRQWYKMPHTASHLLAETAVYGLPEWNKAAIRGASLLANPGCYPTATALALAPLLVGNLVETTGIIVDAKSGVSGAGRAKNDLLYKYAEANESVKPYGVGGTHRHTPEIEQTLSTVCDTPITLSFTPHLIPMTRGILATCYARLADPTITIETVLETFQARYADCPFAIVREAGDFPATKDTAGSNFCHIGAAVDKRTGIVTVVSAIDNLVKGAAGQAVQNMNLMLGLPETAGLEAGGIYP